MADDEIGPDLVALITSQQALYVATTPVNYRVRKMTHAQIGAQIFERG